MWRVTKAKTETPQSFWDDELVARLCVTITAAKLGGILGKADPESWTSNSAHKLYPNLWLFCPPRVGKMRSSISND